MGVGHECCMSPEVLVTAGAGGIAWVFVKLLIIIPVPEDLPRLPTSEEIIEGRWGAPAVALPWNKQVSGFPKISGCQSGANNTFSLQPKHMLCSFSLRPPSLDFRKIIFLNGILEKISYKCSSDFALIKNRRFSFPTASYCVVLRHWSIFPTLPMLRAKDMRKSPYASEMFALKLANLTKIISKTLCSFSLVFLGSTIHWVATQKTWDEISSEGVLEILSDALLGDPINFPWEFTVCF